ncbi:UvrD-helicase domain-containing protein [Pseudoalteromonas lipolytica]
MAKGTFNINDVPKKNRDLILKVAHVHGFKKDKLLKKDFQGLTEKQYQELEEVRSLFRESLKGDDEIESEFKYIPSDKAPLNQNYVGTTLLESINLDEPFSQLKEKAEISLSLRPTVNELLSKKAHDFHNLSEDELLSLQSVLRDGLVEPIAFKEQDKGSFISLPISSCIILQAPPGCGKTHNLVYRLEHHLSQLDKYFDARKILVLSFTRNAVNELRERIATLLEHSNRKSLDLVKVMTFDSFSYEVLLSQFNEAPKDEFDNNIRKVKSILMNHYLGGNKILDEVKWVYIDEYQDLVSCRADLVLALTKFVLKKGGAVSLLGDPFQQIMNFQIAGRNDTTNRNFYEKFRALTKRKLIEVQLSGSYRFKTDKQLKLVHSLRNELQKSPPFVIKGTDFAEVKPFLFENKPGAILCSRNIDCLLIEQNLTDLGIPCSINFGCERIPAPSWIFNIFSFWKQRTMSEATFIAKCQEDKYNSYQTRLEYLQKLGVYNEGTIQVDLLVTALQEQGGVMLNSKHPKITISTVHKAKGLQYPFVAYYETKKLYESNSDALNEFYVAATRAEYSFYFINFNNFPNLYRRNSISPYMYKSSCFLEGIKEIELESFFCETEKISKTNLIACMSNSIRFEVFSENKKVYVVAVVSANIKIKVYRMPRLEKIEYIRNGKANNMELIPKAFSTFIYTGNSRSLELLLGPTCLINIPLFQGLWEFRQ